MNAKELVKSLVQQCNIEAITTKDLARELANLYSSIEELEQNEKALRQMMEATKNEFEQSVKQLNSYRDEFVTPAIKLKADQMSYERDTFKFSLEKKYIERENEMLREIMRSIIATRTHNENYSSGNNGAYWSKSDSIDKPGLPGNPLR